MIWLELEFSHLQHIAKVGSALESVLLGNRLSRGRSGEEVTLIPMTRTYYL